MSRTEKNLVNFKTILQKCIETILRLSFFCYQIIIKFEGHLSNDAIIIFVKIVNNVSKRAYPIQGVFPSVFYAFFGDHPGSNRRKLQRAVHQ
jgi:hypothetical protein